MTLWRNIAAMGLAAALILAAGCGTFGKGGDDLESFNTPAQVLANEAEARYRDGEYTEAADMFQQLKDRFPYSRYALLADLRVGDAYYKAERYDEAVLAYEDFVQLHPKNEGVPYALYQIGMVHHTQMPTADRDPTNPRKAAEAFTRLINGYPTSEWAIKARPRLAEAQHRLANHDMVVGKFYYRTKRYRAAEGRFKRVLTAYPDVGLYNQALEYVKLCQMALAESPDADRPTAPPNRPDLEAAVPNVENPAINLPGE